MKSKLALSSRRDGLNAICCVDSVLQGSARIRMHFLSIEMFWVFLPFFFPLDSRVASDKSPTFHLSIFLTWVLLESNSTNTIVLKGELQLHQGKELIHTHNFFRDLSRCPISPADLHRVSGEQGVLCQEGVLVCKHETQHTWYCGFNLFAFIMLIRDQGEQSVGPGIQMGVQRRATLMER